jgi:hypothetical protein
MAKTFFGFEKFQSPKLLFDSNLFYFLGYLDSLMWWCLNVGGRYVRAIQIPMSDLVLA